MPLTDVHDLLGRSIDDEVVLNHFSSVMKLVERSLESFSAATGLPIFVYFKGEHIFTTSIQTMPQFCQIMLSNSETRSACVANGLDRANLKVPEIGRNIQRCHAGMINGRREIQTEIGNITILFGSVRSSEPTSVAQKTALINKVASTDPNLAKQLAQADDSDGRETLRKEDIALMDSICALVERLLKSTVGFRVLAINMSHELTFTLGELGHGAENNMLTLSKLQPYLDEKDYNDIHLWNSILIAECRLGLYLVRNILSHTSESTYKEAVNPSFSSIDVNNVLHEMLELYKWRAQEKEIDFEVVEIYDLPKIRGLEMEIRRAFHNVLNNAIKYSYHSVKKAKRIIRIRFQVPYDPGFRETTFAIIFENYGLGLSEDEQRLALKAGIRGRQAIREVPIGAGIGLSEVEKIMRVHNGSVKITSRLLHQKEATEPTYLTEVALIFPYKPASI